MKHVLLVEDEPEIAEAIEMLLVNAGYTVTIAQNAQRGDCFAQRFRKLDNLRLLDGRCWDRAVPR